jgi:hypothetical protein
MFMASVKELMRKMMTVILIFACYVLCATNLNAAPPPPKDTDIPKIKSEIEAVVLRVERGASDERELHTAINDLMWYLQRYRKIVRSSPELTHDMTKRLIKVFDKVADIDINKATKSYMIEIIGDSDNSPEAHAFILRMINSKNERYRERALWSMRGNGVRGDDIYDAVKTLIDRGVLKREEFLYALRYANPERGLKEIQGFLATTKDVNMYTSYGLLLCDYKNPELLDILIDRYDEFKNKVPETPEERAVYAPARAAFDPDVLKKYMEIREGKRFAKALAILGSKGISGDEDLALFERKLKSKDPETRKATLDFLDVQISDSAIDRAKARVMLKAANTRETDAALKVKIRRIMKQLTQ